MASKDLLSRIKYGIFASLLFWTLFCAFVFPMQVYAKDIPNSLPSLGTFIATVKDGNANALRGVYIDHVTALAIVQQPARDPNYVSPLESVATQFSSAAERGNVGLLAHDTQAGSAFSNVKQGSLIILVYGDGHMENFMANSIQRYQALEPLNPYGKFIDLETQSSLSGGELFNNVYGGRYHLTLQTCIEKNGDTSWGRLFIMATPIKIETSIRSQ